MQLSLLLVCSRHFWRAPSSATFFPMAEYPLAAIIQIGSPRRRNPIAVKAYTKLRSGESDIESFAKGHRKHIKRNNVEGSPIADR